MAESETAIPISLETMFQALFSFPKSKNVTHTAKYQLNCSLQISL